MRAHGFHQRNAEAFKKRREAQEARVSVQVRHLPLWNVIQPFDLIPQLVLGNEVDDGLIGLLSEASEDHRDTQVVLLPQNDERLQQIQVVFVVPGVGGEKAVAWGQLIFLDHVLVEALVKRQGKLFGCIQVNSMYFVRRKPVFLEDGLPGKFGESQDSAAA